MYEQLLAVPRAPRDIGKHEGRLRRLLVVTGRKEAVLRLLKFLGTAVVAPVASTAETEEQLASVLTVRKGKRLAVVVLRLCECVQRLRAVTGFTQRRARRRCERSDVLSRGPRQLDGAEVVVRDHLGVILWTAERLDPLGRESMLLGAVGARDLPVRHVSDEQMLERELRLTRHGRAPRALDELFALERM